MTRHFLTVLSMALLALSAPAAVIYSGPQNIAIPFDPEGVYVNVFTNAVSYGYPGDFDTAPWINPYFGGACIWTGPLIRPIVTSTLGAGDDQIVNLSYGTIVDHLSTFTTGFGGDGFNVSGETHVGSAINQFQLGTQGYIAYEFEPTVGGPSYFGVMRITVDSFGGATIHDWFYESVASMAIAVPEPSRVFLLLGGLTFLCLRRRRAA
ncbi:MAG: PEP-CTERM sorting domain-containing protein [Verrucomicrobiaceae bacterium]|nr:PEP-CTERM sorting domain-containing protein [Verrucomicrobiaceae bacterium]